MTPDRQRRRATDRSFGFNLRDNWYRDVWLLIITGIVVLSLQAITNTQQQQQQGRHFAVGVTCAAVSAISQAGREVIVGATLGPDTRFEHRLEQLGFPPRKVRHEQAQQAATLYVQNISTRIDETVGHRGDGLVRKDGTIDCARLQHLSLTGSR